MSARPLRGGDRGTPVWRGARRRPQLQPAGGTNADRLRAGVGRRRSELDRTHRLGCHERRLGVGGLTTGCPRRNRCSDGGRSQHQPVEQVALLPRLRPPSIARFRPGVLESVWARSRFRCTEGRAQAVRQRPSAAARPTRRMPRRAGQGECAAYVRLVVACYKEPRPKPVDSRPARSRRFLRVRP